MQVRLYDTGVDIDCGKQESQKIADLKYKMVLLESEHIW